MTRATDDRAELQRAEFLLLTRVEASRGLTVESANILQRINASGPRAPKRRQVWVVEVVVVDEFGRSFSRVAIGHLLDGRAFSPVVIPSVAVERLVDTLALYASTQRAATDDEAA